MLPLFRTPVTRLCAAYGPTLVLMHYLTGCWGRLALGHWPRPSLDDPKDIPGLWIPWSLTMGLGLLLPFAALIPLGRAATGLAGAARTRRSAATTRFLEAALSTGLLLSSLLFLRWDPHQVASWFAD
jgi:hypothetical protein